MNALPSSPCGLVTAIVRTPRFSQVWATTERNLSIASVTSAFLRGSLAVAAVGCHGTTPTIGVVPTVFNSPSDDTLRARVS